MSSTPAEFTHLTVFPQPLQQLLTNPDVDDLVVLAILLAGSIAYIGRGILWDKPDPYHFTWFERPQAGFAGSTATSKSTRNAAQRLAETCQQAVIFWGSQSGTAEGFAHRLARECRRRFKLEVMVADVSEYDPHTIAELSESQYAIFIMSTYGEGDPSDNSTSFVGWLEATPEVSFRNLRFAAFGCGNSNYKRYNAVIDTVVASLQGFGAKMIVPIGKADEAKGTTDEDFLDWKTALLGELCNRLGLTECEPVYEPSINVVFDESIDLSGVYLGEPPDQPSTKVSAGPSSATVPLPITSARELIDGASISRSCLHLELDLSGHPEIKYKTGDHLAIRPINPISEVMALIDILGLKPHENVPIMIQPVGSGSDKLNIPSPTTISALFSHYLEICSSLSRETVVSLAQFASTSSAKNHLLALASDKAVFSAFLAKTHITFTRVLQQTQILDPSATWSALPLSFVIESLRPMTPRYYSISSSSVTSPRRPTITVANNPRPLLEDSTTLIPGLASTYLSTFISNSPAPISLYPPIVNPSLPSATSTTTNALHASIRRSTFKLPASLSTPLIMVAAGTGIAPFRGFLHERARLASLRGQRSVIGRMILIFGCRHPDQDLLYKGELEQLQSTLPALDIVHAFSRLGADKKVYVQDRVAERQDELVSLLLEEDAAFYICGSAAMAREVGSRIGEGVKTARMFDEDGFNKWRRERKRAKRWQEDVWG